MKNVLCAMAMCAWQGCGGPEPAQQRGNDLFHDNALSASPSNPFSCDTCHATSTSDTRRNAGYSLAGAALRPTWWGGSYNYLLDAVNECYVEFMRGTAFTPDEPDGRALLVYLESLGRDGATNALPLTVVKNLTAQYYDSLNGGDAARGKSLYLAACANCHGDLHTGKGRIGTSVSVIPEETIASHGTNPLTGARPTTIEKVRHGKFYLVGGNMPLYGIESLSDRELADILTYMGY